MGRMSAECVNTRRFCDVGRRPWRHSKRGARLRSRAHERTTDTILLLWCRAVPRALFHHIPAKVYVCICVCAYFKSQYGKRLSHRHTRAQMTPPRASIDADGSCAHWKCFIFMFTASYMVSVCVSLARSFGLYRNCLAVNNSSSGASRAQN